MSSLLAQHDSDGLVLVSMSRALQRYRKIRLLLTVSNFAFTDLSWVVQHKYRWGVCLRRWITFKRVKMQSVLVVSMASTPPTVSGSCLHQSIIIPTQKKRANLRFQVSQFTRNQDHAMMPTSRCQHFFDACLHK